MALPSIHAAGNVAVGQGAFAGGGSLLAQIGQQQANANRQFQASCLLSPKISNNILLDQLLQRFKDELCRTFPGRDFIISSDYSVENLAERVHIGEKRPVLAAVYDWGADMAHTAHDILQNMTDKWLKGDK